VRLASDRAETEADGAERCSFRRPVTPHGPSFGELSPDRDQSRAKGAEAESRDVVSDDDRINLRLLFYTAAGSSGVFASFKVLSDSLSTMRRRTRVRLSALM
jgi:hypothetical protein